MPWPMVHFAISYKISFENPTSNFLLGAIAPDAIHMRGNVSREEKGNTHLVCAERLPPKELIMEKCLEYLEKQASSEWKEYIKGYFSHIYTDLRWTETVYSNFEKIYNGHTNEIRNTYNNEVSQIEFYLLKSTSNVNDLFKRLQNTKGYTIEPFVTQLEVIHYRDRKITWLQDNENEPNITPIYFPLESVNSFINQTSIELRDLFKEYDIE